MKTILNQLYTPFLSEIGLSPAEDDSKRSGLFYKPELSLGDGYIWVYQVDNLYVVSIYDIVFNEDISFTYRHPEFFNVGCYDFHYENTDLQAENLLGYVGHDEVYEQAVQKGVPLRSVSVSLAPEFYNSYLPDRFSQSFRKMPDIVSRLKGTDTIPGTAVVLKQIRASQPSGSMAKTYYESKVLELLSIVMQWRESIMS